MRRKLTAIVCADIAGHRGLTRTGKTGIMERLKANRAATGVPRLATHGGRQFKLMGDGALVELFSVIAAEARSAAEQGL